MTPTRRTTALLTASALLLAGAVSLSPSAAGSSASAATPPASVSIQDSALGYPILKAWSAYAVNVDILSSSTAQRFAPGELVVTVKLPGSVDSIRAYPGWTVGHDAGASSFNLSNAEPVVVDSRLYTFFGADAFGSFPRGGVASLSLNRSGLTLVSDTAPLIQ